MHTRRCMVCGMVMKVTRWMRVDTKQVQGEGSFYCQNDECPEYAAPVDEVLT